MASSTGYKSPPKGYEGKGKGTDSYSSGRLLSQDYSGNRLSPRPSYSAPSENSQKYFKQAVYRSDSVSSSKERLPGDLEKTLGVYSNASQSNHDGGRVVCHRCMGELSFGGACKRCGR